MLEECLASLPNENGDTIPFVSLTHRAITPEDNVMNRTEPTRQSQLENIECSQGMTLCLMDIIGLFSKPGRWVSAQLSNKTCVDFICDDNPAEKYHVQLEISLLSYGLLRNTLKVSWPIADHQDNKGFSPGMVHCQNHYRHTLD